MSHVTNVVVLDVMVCDTKKKERLASSGEGLGDYNSRRWVTCNNRVVEFDNYWVVRRYKYAYTDPP